MSQGISRLRSKASLRALCQETTLLASDLIAPIFCHLDSQNQAISALPGQFHYAIEHVADYAQSLWDSGIQAVILFGLSDHHDANGSSSYHQDGAIQQALRAIRAQCPDLTLITDVCLCAYTSHGHCGVLDDHDMIDQLATQEILGKIAQSHAQAGADIVAPSGMVDHMVSAIRHALDEAKFYRVGIMSYSCKYASQFYGPFRSASGCQLKSNRLSYQMNPGNWKEAIHEATLDVGESADFLMVKPAGHYLDIIARLNDQFDVPIVAYQVSGEYAMLYHGASAGALTFEPALYEALLSIKRAGASQIITYGAKQVLDWMQTEHMK